MSAVISYRGKDGLVILTDGATYDGENRLTRIGRKVSFSEKVPLAIACRGSAPCAQMLERKIIEYCEKWGVDDGLEVFSSSLPWLAEAFPDGDSKFHVQVVIAGISESRGAQHWYMQTEGVEDLPAYVLHDMPGSIYYGINGSAADCVADGRIRKPAAHETPVDYFHTVGVNIMQMAREHEATSDKWIGGAHLVGGQVDLTLVTPAGVTVETIHRWNDKVGELIDPTKDRQTGKVVAKLATMNRQQRRAAGRRAKVPRAA